MNVLTVVAATQAVQEPSAAHEIGGLFALLVVLSLYLLPWIISKIRNHHNSGAIFVLNLFLGWTFLGWIGSLIWSCTKVVKGG